MTNSYSKEKIYKEILDSILVKEALSNDAALLEKVKNLAKTCTDSLNSGGKIILCGNGGSFADAQHLSAEFTSRFLFDRPGLPSIALGTNSSAMTAIGNDYGYENVFSREIESIAEERDTLIAISTSGNSINVLKAIEAAEKIPMKVFVLTGQNMGKLKNSSGVINVPSSDTARIQECHILIGHIVCGIVEETIFGKN